MALPVYYMSLDIESEGDGYDNPVIAIGAVFGPADGSWPRAELKRFRGNLEPLPGQRPDPACMTEFWAKFSDVRAEIRAGAQPAGLVLSAFQQWMQQLLAAYEDSAAAAPGRIKIVSDCPDFDLGRLDALAMLQTQTWERGVRYLGGVTRHGQVDPGERLAALGARAQCDAWIAAAYPGVVHDHRPDNDAEHAYYQMVYLHTQQQQQPGKK
jgi:hypothetical protein